MDQDKLMFVLLSLLTILTLGIAITADMSLSEDTLFYGLIPFFAVLAIHSGYKWLA